MYIGWTKHLSEEKEIQAFQNQVWSSKRVLERLKDLIELEEKAVDDTERDPKAYDNPAWAYKQAFKNGVRKGLSVIKQMVDLDRQQPPKEKDNDR